MNANDNYARAVDQARFAMAVKAERIERMARLILARDTSMRWSEATTEIKTDCRESARAEDTVRI